MIQYSGNKEVAYYNGSKFNRDKKTGYYLSTKPTDTGKRERLHVYVWRIQNGTIPKGCHIHHKDENKYNNDINNLELLTRHNHLSIHAKENKEDAIKRMIKYAMPKAKEWHKSETGHKWHIEHGKKVFSGYKGVELICEQCGKEYKARNNAKNFSRFCSNKCKSAQRRQSGVDNENRNCTICGSAFLVNKYSKAVCCSKKCAAIYRITKRTA